MLCVVGKRGLDLLLSSILNFIDFSVDLLSFPRAWADDGKIHSGDRPISLFGNAHAHTTHVLPEQQSVLSFFLKYRFQLKHTFACDTIKNEDSDALLMLVNKITPCCYEEIHKDTDVICAYIPSGHIQLLWIYACCYMLKRITFYVT